VAATTMSPARAIFFIVFVPFRKIGTALRRPGRSDYLQPPDYA